MILLIDLCWKKDSLSRYEFVLPIAKIVSRAGLEYEIKHHSESKTHLVIMMEDGSFLRFPPSLIKRGKELGKKHPEDKFKKKSFWKKLFC